MLLNLCLCIVFAASFKITSQRSTIEDDSYVAAVVEYEVQSDVEENVRKYVQLIEEAAQENADVVVFPELTLTRGSYSMKVPIHGLLKEYPVPSLQPLLYDTMLVNMSAAARDNQVYLVINVQEEMDCTNIEEKVGEYCPEEKVYYFNSNVIFDRKGVVINRYRKINLYNEQTRTPSLQPDFGIFTTDFGVRFGHFVCFDLIYQMPSIDILQHHNLTDIIFTTMWFSQMPYLTAVQIQEAYAYSMGVNFLAAGANSLSVGSTGSGIYSGKVGALVSITSGEPTTRLLVARVPKVPGQVKGNITGPIYDDPSKLHNLFLKTDGSILSHHTRQLVPGFQDFTIIDTKISCRFRVRMSEGHGEFVYKYRAAAYSRERIFTGFGVVQSRICSVVACTGDTVNSCGTRFPQYVENATAVFDELLITAEAKVEDEEARAIFPVSLDTSIMPLKPQDFIYKEDRQSQKTTFIMGLNRTDAELFTFGVWGRVFDRDLVDVEDMTDIY